MPGVSVSVGEEEIWEGSYYKVLEQDIIDLSGEGKVFGLAMFEWTNGYISRHYLSFIVLLYQMKNQSLWIEAMDPRQQISRFIGRI